MPAFLAEIVATIVCLTISLISQWVKKVGQINKGCLYLQFTFIKNK